MNPAPVLYIGGWGRSGSTILSYQLGRIPGLVAVGELRYVWQGGVAANELCGCGAPFHECPFWTAVGQEAFGGWDQVDAEELLALEAAVLRHSRIPLLAAPRLAPAQQKRLARYAETTERLYRAILTVSGAHTVVDSTKNPPYAYFLRRVPGVRLRVLHLVRDSRGVVFSWRKKVARPEVADGADMPRYSPLEAARRWLLCNLSFEVLRRLDTPTARVRYEELASWPRPTLERALAELGEQPAVDLSFLDAGEVEVDAQHSIRGNPLRFARGRRAIRLDEEWKREMGPRERRLVLLLTWPLLLGYGYLRGAS